MHLEKMLNGRKKEKKIKKLNPPIITSPLKKMSTPSAKKEKQKNFKKKMEKI